MSNSKSRASNRKAVAHKKAGSSYIGNELSWFGPKPLVEGDSEEAYDALAQQVRMAVDPSDVLEETWCRDVVDSLWEAQRLRRLKAALLKSARPQGLKRLLGSPDDFVQEVEVDRQIRNWTVQDPDALKHAAEMLELMGLDDCAIDAHALAENIDLVGEFDILITRTDARRHFALQEMRRHKEFALRMKRAISEVLEAEFREVETGALEQ